MRLFSSASILFAALTLGVSSCGQTAPDEPTPADAPEAHGSHDDGHEAEHVHEDAEREAHGSEDVHEDEAHDDHDEHAHDHDTHAGGTAHVHGEADLSIVSDGHVLTVDLISPMANFGLAESGENVPSQAAFADLIAEAEPLMNPSADALCGDPDVVVAIDESGAHAEGLVTWTFACEASHNLNSVAVELFEAFPAFETLDAVGFRGEDDTADELTFANPNFSFD